MKDYNNWLMEENIMPGQPVAPPSISRGDAIFKMRLITQKLGDKAGKYRPLINAIATRPGLLDLFSSLIDDLLGMSVAKGGNVLSRFQTHMGPQTPAQSA